MRPYAAFIVTLIAVPIMLVVMGEFIGRMMLA